MKASFDFFLISAKSKNIRFWRGDVFALRHEPLEDIVEVRGQRPIAEAEDVEIGENFLQLLRPEPGFDVFPSEVGHGLEIAHQDLSVGKFEDDRQRWISERKNLAVVGELCEGRIDLLVAVESGKDGFDSQERRYATGVDSASALAAALPHQFDADAAVRPFDQ